MTLYTIRSGDRPRPLGDIPQDGFKAWHKQASAKAAAGMNVVRDLDLHNPRRIRAVNISLSLRRFSGYTNVMDPLKGFQEGLIARVISDAGAMRYAVDINAEPVVYERIQDDYTTSVQALAAYTGGDFDLIWQAGDDQDMVIRAALAHL